MGFGCGDVVGFVVKCVNHEISLQNPTNATHIPIPKSHQDAGEVGKVEAAVIRVNRAPLPWMGFGYGNMCGIYRIS